MKRIIIDGRLFSDMVCVHRFLKAALDLPEYYGANLDALHDCLTEIGYELQVEFVDFDQFISKIGPKAQTFRNVFADAANENPNIKLI